MLVEIATEDIACYGERNGKIRIQIKNSTIDYKIAIQSLNKNSTKYFIGSSDSTYTISNLAAGKYQVKTSTDIAIICDTIINLNEPNTFNVNKIQVVKQPSSENASDGIIVASAYGGTSPYSYQWDKNANNQTTDTASNLIYGIYTCTVTDASNCNENSKPMTIYFVEELIKNQQKNEP